MKQRCLVQLSILMFIITSTLSSQSDTTLEIDSDEMVMKMKKFLDIYADHLKKSQNRKDAYKILVPSQKTGQTVSTFSENFNLVNFQNEVDSFVESVQKIMESQLRSTREEKQSVDEKNIDLSTKHKILSNRMNLAKNEFSKMKNDFNVKNRNKVYMITENRNMEDKNKKTLEELKAKNDNLFSNLRKFDKEVLKSNITETLYESDIKNRDQLTKLNLQNFKIINDIESIEKRYNSEKKFNFYLENLKVLVDKNQNLTTFKNKRIQNSLVAKQVKLENLKKNIKFKYETYDNLNKTFNKLKNIKSEYRGVLGKLDDSISQLKSKKRVILDNIEEKKKQLRIKERTISTVLGNFEKQLDNINLNKIKYELEKNELYQIKNRIKQLLDKENLIFKNHKIK